MITLEKIIASNLEMLKSQEAELLKSLSFVQKAKKLFQSQNGERRGRPKGKSKSRKKYAARVKATSSKSARGRTRPSGEPKAATVKSAKGRPPKDGLDLVRIRPVGEPKSVRAPKPGTHLANIISILKQKNEPMKAHDLIETLFNQQTTDKNIKHYRSLISPTLSNAYKRGILLQKEGKILLPA